MSDKLVLTLLGAIGIGALVMGMNEDRKLQENWMGIQGVVFNKEKVEFDATTGEQVGTVEANDKNVINAVLNLGAAGRKADREAKQEAAIKASIKENYEDMYTRDGERFECDPNDPNCGEQYGMYDEGTEQYGMYDGGDGEQYDCDPNDPNCNAEQFRENWEESNNYQLGSGMVADDSIFHRNPQFNQSIPQPSPDMQNLGVPARMHVSSMQGYTDSFNQPMQYANFIETYEDPKPTQAAKPKSSSTTGTLPPSDMNNPDSNVIVFERLMASTRGGGRFNRSGTVDYIRGDIPVCPDPCQSGWFKSSAKPQDVLQVGAVAQMIAGDNTAKDLEMLLKNHGRIIQQFTPSDMATTVSKSTGTIGTKQLP